MSFNSLFKSASDLHSQAVALGYTIQRSLYPCNAVNLIERPVYSLDMSVKPAKRENNDQACHFCPIASSDELAIAVTSGIC
jgi:hypothetical protein